MIVLIRVPVGPHLPDSWWDRFLELDEALSMKKAHRKLGRYAHYQVRPLPIARREEEERERKREEG